jgi:hypothetical protein
MKSVKVDPVRCEVEAERQCTRATVWRRCALDVNSAKNVPAIPCRSTFQTSRAAPARVSAFLRSLQ